MTAANITIQACDAVNQKKIIFYNVGGTGQFIFSIRGATTDIPTVDKGEENSD